MGAEDPDRIVVIREIDGTILSVGRMSPKAVRKSVEQGRLWWLHQETRRVLPFEGYELVSLETGKPWVEAIVRAETSSAADGHGGPDETGHPVGEAVGPSDSEHEPVGAVPVDHVPGNERISDFSSILLELAQLVHQRNLDRPEGSYTSYLFAEGNEKIRKKTGEEAVELILARKRGEIVYEAADLIYHLLVLFEAEGIPVQELLQELASRRH